MSQEAISAAKAALNGDRRRNSWVERRFGCALRECLSRPRLSALLNHVYDVAMSSYKDNPDRMSAAKLLLDKAMPRRNSDAADPAMAVPQINVLVMDGGELDRRTRMLREELGRA